MATLAQLRPNTSILQGSIKNSNEQVNFSDNVFPTVKVDNRNVEWYEWDNYAMQIGDSLEHSAGAHFSRFENSLSTDSTTLVEYGEETTLSREQIEQAASQLNLELETLNGLNDRMLLQKEYSGATVLGATANYGSNASPSTKWDASSSTAVSDIFTGVEAIVTATDKMPNTIVFSHNAWLAFRTSDQVVDQMKYTQGQYLTPGEAANLLSIPNVIIARASYYNAAGTRTKLYDEWVGLYYVSTMPGRMSQSYGYYFEMDQYPVIEEYTEDARRALVMRWVNWYKHEVVSKNCGYILTNTLT